MLSPHLVSELLRKCLGYSLQIKPSSVDHPDAGTLEGWAVGWLLALLFSPSAAATSLQNKCSQFVQHLCCAHLHHFSTWLHRQALLTLALLQFWLLSCRPWAICARQRSRRLCGGHFARHHVFAYAAHTYAQLP